MQNPNTFRLNGAQLDKTVLDNLNATTDSATHIKDTLTTALKIRLASALTENGYTVLAGLIQNMDPVDIVANKDVPLRTFVANQVQSKVQNDVVLRTAVDEEINKLSSTTTVGDLLDLNMPLKDHPLFKDEAQKAALSSLLATSPALTDLQLQATFISLYAQHQGTIQDFWSSLSQQPEFKAPGIVEQLQFTLQLGLLTQYNVPLVKVLQDRHQQGSLSSLRDLIQLSENDWIQLINDPQYGINVPTSIPGTTRDEQVANYVRSITGTLRSTFPTAYIARVITKPAATPLTANALIREDVITPFSLQHPLRDALTQFFANEPDFAFSDTHIDTYLAEHGDTALKGIDPQQKPALAAQLKTWQRISRVTSEPTSMHTLLQAGLDSAHAIASLPQSTFVEHFQAGLGGETEAQQAYARAKQVSALAMTTFGNLHQYLNDASPRVIGTASTAAAYALKKIPNWTTLFGPLQLCDCEQCHSVYSAAAYFVDLLQFLNLPRPLSYRYVRAVKTAPEYFFITELRVFEEEGGNVAQGKSASASSTWGPDYMPAKANDGDTSTGWSPTGADTACWWQVDLGQPYLISQIQLVTRQELDQPETRQNFEIWASNNSDMSEHVVLGSQGKTPLPYQATWSAITVFVDLLQFLNLPQTPSYRYVKAVKTAPEYFFITELRVFEEGGGQCRPGKEC